MRARRWQAARDNGDRVRSARIGLVQACTNTDARLGDRRLPGLIGWRPHRWPKVWGRPDGTNLQSIVTA